MYKISNQPFTIELINDLISNKTIIQLSDEVISNINSCYSFLNSKIENLHKNLFLESNPIPVKWALHKLGRCKKGIRLPLLELSSDYQSVIENDLKELNLL